MSSALDMSLDDIIKTNKKSGSSSYSSRGRGRGGGSGPGPSRRAQNHRGNNRATPYSTNTTTTTKAPESAWKHDMFAEQGMGFVTQAAGARGNNASIETGTKLYISNLEYGVSNEDIKELFSEVGDLKRNTIHYDRSGRSKGTAEVVFSRRSDAVAAVKRYNNVQLDGKPMKIEIVGTNITTPSFPGNAGFGNGNGFPGSGGRGGALGRIRGGGGGFGGNRGEFGGNRGDSGGNRGGRVSGRGGRGRGRGRDEKVSPEDLDADLEKYHSEAMQTN